MFVLMAMCAVMVSAQNWDVFHQDGDELINLPDLDGMIYSEGGFSFVFWDTVDDDFKLVSPTIFNYETGMYRGAAEGGERVYGVVGIYSNDDKLVKKFENYVFETVNRVCYQVHSNKYSHRGGNNKKNAKKIINYIKNSNGYVRFVLPLYNSPVNFDLKVKCLGSSEAKFE